MAVIIDKKSERTGKLSYEVQIRKKGIKNITKSFKSKIEAKNFIIETEAKILKGERITSVDIKRLTINEIADEYVNCNVLNSNNKSEINIVRAWFGELTQINITSKVLNRFIATLKTTNNARGKLYEEATIRKLYYRLKIMIDWHCLEYDYLTLTNAFKLVKAPSTDIKRDRRLEKGEIQKLFKASNKMYKNKNEYKLIILFAINTAMRLGEILKLEWKYVNFENRLISLTKEITKSNESRIIPMSSITYKLLKNRFGSGKDGRVFGCWSDTNAFEHRWALIVKNSNIKDLHFHDLRHEATCMFYEKTNLRDIEIAHITGHTDLKMLKRYANLRPHYLSSKLW